MASSGRFGLPSAAAFCGVLVPLFYLFDASDSHRPLLRARCTEANFPRFVKRLVKSLMLLAPVASHSQLDCGIGFQLGMTRNRNLVFDMPRRGPNVTNANRYPAQVSWSNEDSGFIAIAPDLPGCSAFGETQQEALAELQDAIAAWIEAAQSAGNPIPEPKPSPARKSDYRSWKWHWSKGGLAEAVIGSCIGFAVVWLAYSSINYHFDGHFWPFPQSRREAK
jgi:predicted RNase H-like HicB family nuclease